MANLNRVVISGNLTRDAQLKVTTGGTSVLTFTLAVNERRKDGSTDAYFFDCVMFGSDKIAHFLTKGRKVGISGRLRQNRWEQDGQKRSRVEIIADLVEFFDSGKQQQTSQPDLYDEDIPF